MRNHQVWKILFQSILAAICSLLLASCGGGSHDDNVQTAAQDTSPKYPLPFAASSVPMFSGTVLFVAQNVTTLAYSDLYLVTATNKTPQFLTKTGWISSVSFSPNGMAYVFEDNHNQSALYTRAGTLITTSSGSPDLEDTYSWTSDSRFAYYGQYYNGIFEIAMSGSSRQVVVNKPGTYDHSVAVSPGGTYLMWSHHEYGNQLTVYVVERVKLPLVNSYAGSRLLWSGSTANHDEQQETVFLNDQEFLLAITTIGNTRFYLGNAATGAIQEVMTTSTKYGIGSLALSPDRSTIAYSTYDGIFTARIGEWKEVVVDQNFLASPYRIAWSLDGRYLVAAGGRDTSSGEKKVQVVLYQPGTSQKWQLGVVSGYEADSLAIGP